MLAAEDEINLIAAKNTDEQHSTNKSSSGSIGISIGTSGFGVTASASSGRGNADGSDVNWSNTHVNAANQLALVSGGDANLIGAVASGKQVVANVGGDLNIESLQDTSKYDSKQKNIGGSVTIGAGGGGSLSYSKSSINSDYASVTEQSGIKAGDAGFQVNVQGKTDLKGAVIASTEKAVQDDKNILVTASLNISDIQNKASYEGKSMGLNVGSAVSTNGKLAPSGTSVGFGKDSDSTSSVTQSGVSGIAGNKNVRSTDEETALAKIFDAERVQKEIDAQTQITQRFGQEAPKAWGQYANTKFAEALKAGEEEGISCWGPDGTCRAGGHAILGGLTGGINGAIGAGGASIAAPHVQSFLIEQGLQPSAASALTQLSAVGAGLSAGGVQGAAGALNETANNAVVIIPLIVEGIITGGAIAARACLSSPACLNALRLGGTAMVAKVVSLLPPEELALLPGFGAGEQPPKIGPLVTPILDPQQAQKYFGPPPLQNPDELRSWLSNVLEGYPANEAEKWANGFIISLPVAQQQTLSDLIMMSVQENAVAGSRREREVTIDLQAMYPNGSVQNQQYLRDKEGNIVIDPATGTGRRLDHVVIVNGKVVDVVETTSLTAEKQTQLRHERETRNAGGTYIRDRATGNLIEVPSISRIERRP